MLILLLFPLAHAQVPLELTTDKTEYSLGDQLVVSGTTSINTALAIQVFNPFTIQIGIGQVQSGADGSFELIVLSFPLDFNEDYPPGE
ncbi:MAG: hypothetical protein V3T23_07810, partial [Nitrososphaerales archaeon]